MRVILTMMLVAIATGSLQAEQIRLKNGDVIFASVVSLDEKTLKLKSENFGEVSVDRDSVVEIRFAEPIGSSWRSVRPMPHWPSPTPGEYSAPVPYMSPTRAIVPASPPSPSIGPSIYLPPASGYTPTPYPSPAAAPAATIPALPPSLAPRPASSTRSLQSEIIMGLLSEKNLEAARKRAQETIAGLESLKAGKQTAVAERELDECLQLLRDFLRGKPSP